MLLKYIINVIALKICLFRMCTAIYCDIFNNILQVKMQISRIDYVPIKVIIDLYINYVCTYNVLNYVGLY